VDYRLSGSERRPPAALGEKPNAKETPPPKNSRHNQQAFAAIHAVAAIDVDPAP
jgi:hypothetical protein